MFSGGGAGGGGDRLALRGQQFLHALGDLLQVRLGCGSAGARASPTPASSVAWCGPDFDGPVLNGVD